VNVEVTDKYRCGTESNGIRLVKSLKSDMTLTQVTCRVFSDRKALSKAISSKLSSYVDRRDNNDHHVKNKRQRRMGILT
jgi:hypothetical protein